MANPNQDKKQARPVGLGVGPLLDAAAMAQFQNQQPDSIPGMFKPGEFVLPPDTVHALGGKAVLQDAVNRTHTPGNSGAIVPAGFKPEMFFAQGGAPEDEIKKANSFGDSAGAAANPGMQVAQPRSQQIADKMLVGPASTRQELNQQQQLGRQYQTALGNERYEAGAAQMAQEARDAAYKRQTRAFGASPLYNSSTVPETSKAQPALDAWDNSNPQFKPGTASTAPAAPAGYDNVSSGEMGPPDLSTLSRGTAALFMPTTPSAAPAPAPASTPTGAVTRTGNSYSGTNVGGDISINGGTPSGGFVGGVGALLQRSTAQSPADQVPQFNSPQVAHSGNDWEARNNLRNLEVSASSITNNGGAFDSRRGRINGPSAAQTAFQDAQRADLAARGVQPVLDSQTNQVNSNLQREGMQQRGSDFRGGVQALLEQQRINQAGVTAGYANRAAGQAEQMRDRIMNETDPAKRRALTDTMMAMEGRQPQSEWGVQVTPTTKNLDGTTSMGSVIRYNKSTGQVEPVSMGQAGQQASGELGNPATRPVGTVSTVNGKSAVWNGQTWVPSA